MSDLPDSSSSARVRHEGAEAELFAASDPAQAARWDELVSDSAAPDSYYRPGYVRAYEIEEHGGAVALHVPVEDASFLFPFLLRPVSALPFAGDASEQDAITAYGYGGMLCRSSRSPSTEQLRSAMTAFKQWCKSHSVVACMLRLHPLLEQDYWLEPLADVDLSIHPFGPTTAIPVQEWSEEALRKDRRANLKLARRSLTLTWSSRTGSSPDALPLREALVSFRGLYEETMERLQASAFYRFSPRYYQALAEGLGDNIAVALAWSGSEPVGGSIFLCDRRYAHYHLSATNAAGRTLKATTLLIRAGVDWARSRGCSRLHLGGGVSGDDPLFDFKRSFGGSVHRYAFAGLVCDRQRYQELVARRHAHSDAPLRPNFFPAYRA